MTDVYQTTVVPLEDDGKRCKTRRKLTTILKSKVNRFFSVENLHRRVPITVWIREYNFDCLIGDLIAGTTVGLMLIPQALAYGLVAGLPPNYGLYSAWMGCFVYFFLGSTKEMNIGPTAIMALMTLHYTSQGGPDFAIVLCFAAGIIEFVAAVVNLGFLINFISQPVISGFTSAAAITIFSSQLKSLFGLKLKTQGLLDTWIKVASNLSDFRWQDMTLGLMSIAVLVFMQHMRNLKCKSVEKSPVLQKVIFFLSVGRNALVVIISSVIAYMLDGEDQPFTLTGEVKSGIPSFAPPPFTTTINNETMTFGDILSDVGVGVVMIPFIAILDNIAIVSAFAKGKTFDATQEILTLGVINILGSFFSAIPTTGSLSRMAVNKTSGVCSPAGGLVTGAMVLLALAFLTPLFRYIPKATLAAVIMCAVVHMIDYEIVKPLWKSRKPDIIPLAVTFFACMFIGLEWGILLGIGLHLSMMLFTIATPAVLVTPKIMEVSGNSYILVTPSHGIFYPSTSHVRTALQKAATRQGAGVLPVVIDCTFLVVADFTSARGLKGSVEEFERRGQTLVFFNLKAQVYKAIAALKSIITIDSLDELERVLKAAEMESNFSNHTTSELEAQSVRLIDVKRQMSIIEDSQDPEHQLLAPTLAGEEN